MPPQRKGASAAETAAEKIIWFTLDKARPQFKTKLVVESSTDLADAYAGLFANAAALAIDFTLMDVDKTSQGDREVKMNMLLSELEETASSPLVIHLKKKDKKDAKASDLELQVAAGSARGNKEQRQLAMLKFVAEENNLKLDFDCKQYDANDPIWDMTGGTRPNPARAAFLSDMKASMWHPKAGSDVVDEEIEATSSGDETPIAVHKTYASTNNLSCVAYFKFRTCYGDNARMCCD